MTTQPQSLRRQPMGQPNQDGPCAEIDPAGTEKLLPLRSTERTPAIQKCMSPKSLLRLDGDHRGERITCLKGGIWITQTGKPEDIFLFGGESFSITQRGELLIEGLVESRLKITRSRKAKNGWNFGSILL